MKSLYNKDVRNALVFAAALFLLSFLLFHFVIPQYYITAFPILLLVFTLYSIFSQQYLGDIESMRPQAFFNRFMLVTTAKLLLLLMIVVFYIVVIRTKSFEFLIELLIIYFCYLVFDVTNLLHKSRTPSDK